MPRGASGGERAALESLLRQMEQQRLELQKAAGKKVNFLEWALLCGLLVIMGVFIRYVFLYNH